MSKWMPDGSGTRARIGVLTPHMDPVPESEFQAMAPPGVSIHAARVPLGMVGPDGAIIPRVDAEIAKAFAAPPAVDNAAAILSAVNPAAVVYGFTSSSYILGAAADDALRQRLESKCNGTPVVIQTDALATALRSLRARRIALIHPPWFTDELDALGAAYFRGRGFYVDGHGPARIRSEYGDMTPEQIYNWVTEHTPDTAEAAVIAGGGFRAIGAIAAIETALNKPVLSANQASFWMALRLAGCTDMPTGYGRLFHLGVAT